MKNMWKEFKKFALKGNMLDLAIGVIIGGAFSSLISSVVNDLVMPLLSLVTGNLDFSNLFFALDGGEYATLQMAKDAGAATFNYGKFLTNALDFLIMAFVVFLFVKGINRLRQAVEPQTEPVADRVCPYCKSKVAPEATRCPYCTSEIEAEPEAPAK